MFTVLNNYNSFILFLCNFVFCGFSFYYLSLLSIVLLLFLCYRIPYCYSPFIFGIFLISIVFSMFISLFFCRVLNNVNEFFGTLIPVGTPLYICPLVCLAETVSYIIRPIVLILRPFINISLGCFGAVALCNLSFGSSAWILLLFILFFYEVFVAIVHWYIVSSILSFSVDH
uniref:ATP synthase F0 subunit 6 n=1 Tax=Anoplocephala magna TaxID=218193 RepID=A0A2Z1GGA6_9CEST|nr:ATP synthase F0 subunit 6 [Anoplocephala magna]AMR73960.1 ATP synthase F0 subunit 6 [Anoplocephala magna]